jgi:hypothetical protein
MVPRTQKASFLGYALKTRTTKKINKGIQVEKLVMADQKASWFSMPKLFR